MERRKKEDYSLYRGCKLFLSEDRLEVVRVDYYYKLKSLELDDRTTLVLSNTRELNRELFYKLVYLI